MDAICPLLTLGGDPRTVSASADPAHQCSAGRSLSPIERDYQLRFCLTDRYEACERFRAHVDLHGPVGPTWAPAAADASFVSTRVVMESAPRSVIARRPRRLGTALFVVIGLVLFGVVAGWAGIQGLGIILGPADGRSPTPSASVASQPATSEAPASPRVSPTPTPGPTPTPAPTPITYIVQSGDTLNAIAARYGTTAQAIMQANGLTSEIIQVGQVLIIPLP